MGYRDAIEDGILFAENRRGYYPPCHVCGASTFSLNYIRGMKYTCPDCRQYLAEAKIR